jgi:integrase
VFLRDVDSGRAAEWLNGLRRPGHAVELPARVDSFTPAETVALLGVSRTELRAAGKRYGLPAEGSGKACRLPRATVLSLADRAGQGTGPETVNHYIRAARGFFRWLVKSKRAGANPLDSLSLLNARVDVRRARRDLTTDELRNLLLVTRESARNYRGLTGTDWFHLYLTAAATGFRANALANLTPAEFDLAGDLPTVTLTARFNKSRKPKVQPLPEKTAGELRRFLTGRPERGPVWGGTWARNHRGADMLRGDLVAVGIRYAVEGPDCPEYADFHALRHSYLTLGGWSGIDLRTLQELAGHSRQELTARYSHSRLYDLAGAVGKFPTLVPETSKGEAESLRATGTDGTPDVPRDVPKDVPSRRTDRHQTAPIYTLSVFGPGANESPQPLEMQGAGVSQHRPAPICTSEGDGTRTRNHRIDSVIRRPAASPSLTIPYGPKPLGPL